jgi:hypothetical protein
MKTSKIWRGTSPGIPSRSQLEMILIPKAPPKRGLPSSLPPVAAKSTAIDFRKANFAPA